MNLIFALLSFFCLPRLSLYPTSPSQSPNPQKPHRSIHYCLLFFSKPYVTPNPFASLQPICLPPSPLVAHKDFFFFFFFLPFFFPLPPSLFFPIHNFFPPQDFSYFFFVFFFCVPSLLHFFTSSLQTIFLIFIAELYPCVGCSGVWNFGHVHKFSQLFTSFHKFSQHSICHFYVKSCEKL